MAWLASPGDVAARTDSNRATARRARFASPTAMPRFTRRDPASVHAPGSTGTASSDCPDDISGNISQTEFGRNRGPRRQSRAPARQGQFLRRHMAGITAAAASAAARATSGRTVVYVSEVIAREEWPSMSSCRIHSASWFTRNWLALSSPRSDSGGVRYRTTGCLPPRPLRLLTADSRGGRRKRHLLAEPVPGRAPLSLMARSTVPARAGPGEAGAGPRLRAGSGHFPGREKAGTAFGGGHRDVQPAPPPVLPAGASPGSTVLPGTTRLPPAARVTSTRRAWVFGDAGMVTCRTPSA